ncbi:hypothetical protein OG909_32875 (plasmid) [Streptomyces sp. NBC_01754]|uniref:hypothetical protein n=1 Tax=Streptomyces sp. NBC_01754 TaxID=2975930 RepID=UPI002DD8D1F2|nr:hypothetical protein [Streptomyces sp. NBC_01754]WSC97100.1 hypothetical protein OG909_32875 [Streptomyces sp. NBC_01754]
MIWTPEDVARDQVRRQAAGMTVRQVDQAVDTAVVRVRETRQELRSPMAVRGEFAPDPEELADRWAALLTEWRRVAAHLAASGTGAYDSDLDETGCAWAREREDRRAGALRTHAAWMERRREEQDELRAELWMGAATGRRVRAVAARAGLAPDEVLSQLAERVSVDDDGAVSVAPFIPGRAAGASEER